MNRIFVKEHDEYIRKDFTDDELVTWFKDHSTQIPTHAPLYSPMNNGKMRIKEFPEEHGRTMDADVISYTEAEIKADGDGFNWVLSDFTLDRDMERMDPSGWDLKEFRKNPIVLWGHDSWVPAIGMMKNVKKASDEKGELTGTVMLDESGADPLATMIAAKVRSGILTKGSVGFRTKKIEILEGARDGTRLIHREQELMEFSIVNIPANPSAQVQRQWEGRLDPKTSVFPDGVEIHGVLRETDSPEKIVAHGVGMAMMRRVDERCERMTTDPKNYVELLMQDNGGSETSPPGETSRIEDLFAHSPAVSGENQKIEEIFHASN